MSSKLVMPSNLCHLLLCHPLLLPPSIFPSIRVFSNESVLHIRWPKYWRFSFSISPSNEYSGPISFRMDWLDLLAVQDSHESSPTPQFKSINSFALSLLHSPTLTSIHDHWKIMPTALCYLKPKLDFPGGPVVKNPPVNAGDMGLIPDLRRFHMPRSN